MSQRPLTITGQIEQRLAAWEVSCISTQFENKDQHYNKTKAESKEIMKTLWVSKIGENIIYNLLLYSMEF